MINEAATLHILDAERVDAAREIHSAGNAAIHDSIAFSKQYRAKMRQIVDNTRKVILDLHS